MKGLKKLFSKILPWYDSEAMERRTVDTIEKVRDSRRAIQAAELELFHSYYRANKAMARKSHNGMTT
jgi:hypothetical protein